MKIKIEFEHRSEEIELAHWARAEGLFACANTFEEAKQRLIQKLKAKYTVADHREPEEVEI